MAGSTNEPRIHIEEFFSSLDDPKPEVKAGFSVYVGKLWMTPTEWEEKYKEYRER